MTIKEMYDIIVLVYFIFIKLKKRKDYKMAVKSAYKQNESEALDTYVNMLKALENPSAILDMFLRCIWSSDENIIGKGDFFPKNYFNLMDFPTDRVNEINFCKNGKSYCVRIVPVKLDGRDKMFFCEFFDYQASLELMKKSFDICSEKSKINIIKSDLANLWNIVYDLKNNFLQSSDSENYRKLLKFENSLIIVDSKLRSSIEYFSFSKEDLQENYYNLGDLIKTAVKRCNDIIAGTGKNVVFSSESELFIISADKRLCLSTIANALQNALLYSKSDSSPEIILRKAKDKNLRRALITIKCESSPDKIAEFKENGFSRNPFGMSIIQQSVNSCGGKVSLSCEENKICLNILLPVLKNSSTIRFHNSEYSFYRTASPDYLTLKMLETVILLEEDPK